MKIRERIGQIIMIVGFVLGFTAGLVLAYMIHVKWHFLGATFVQLQTVVALWSLSPLTISMLGGYIGALLGEKIVR